MAAGISDHVWSIEEIIGLLDAAEKKSGVAKNEGAATPLLRRWQRHPDVLLKCGLSLIYDSSIRPNQHAVNLK